MTLEDIIRLRIGQWEPISHLRRPLQEFLQGFFPNLPSETIEEQAIERILSQLRPHFQNLLNAEEDNSRNGSRIDICATVETLFRRHIKDILHHLFNNGINPYLLSMYSISMFTCTLHELSFVPEIDDGRFGQEILSVVNNMGRQLCAVIRYSIRGGQAGLEVVVSRSVVRNFS